MLMNICCVIRCVQTETKINWHKCNSVWKRKHTECPWGEAGCANSRYVPDKRLKVVLVGCSSKSVGAYWDRKNANKWNIIKLKHVQNGENVIVCGKPNSLCCDAGDVISKFCASQATKNGSLDRSTEPLGAHWDEQIAKKIEHRNEACSDISKQENKRWTSKKNSSFKTKLLVVRQMIHPKY